LATHSATQMLAQRLVDPGSTDELAAMRQLGLGPDVRGELHRRLVSGLDELVESLVVSLGDLCRDDVTDSCSVVSVAESSAMSASDEDGVKQRVVAVADVPKILIVGAINVDVTAHVCGEINATTASTISGSDDPPSFTQGGRGFNQAVACARLGSTVKLGSNSRPVLPPRVARMRMSVSLASRPAVCACVPPLAPCLQLRLIWSPR
jgi:hypothetical protein